MAKPPAGSDFIAIAAGREHSLAVKSDGSVVGWGRNDYGQATAPAGNNFIAIAAGSDFSLPIAVVNTPPVAIAGPNQTAYALMDEMAEVTLDGSASYDEDGDELTYRWSWEIDSNIYEANGVTPTIELPVGQLVTGRYFFGQRTTRIINPPRCRPRRPWWRR